MTDRLRIILTILTVAAVTALAIWLVKPAETPAPEPSPAQTEEAGPVS